MINVQRAWDYYVSGRLLDAIFELSISTLYLKAWRWYQLSDERDMKDALGEPFAGAEELQNLETELNAAILVAYKEEKEGNRKPRKGMIVAETVILRGQRYTYNPLYRTKVFDFCRDMNPMWVPSYVRKVEMRESFAFSGSSGTFIHAQKPKHDTCGTELPYIFMHEIIAVLKLISSIEGCYIGITTTPPTKERGDLRPGTFFACKVVRKKKDTNVFIGLPTEENPDRIRFITESHLLKRASAYEKLKNSALKRDKSKPKMSRKDLLNLLSNSELSAVIRGMRLVGYEDDCKQYDELIEFFEKKRVEKVPVKELFPEKIEEFHKVQELLVTVCNEQLKIRVR